MIPALSSRSVSADASAPVVEPDTLEPFQSRLPSRSHRPDPPPDPGLATWLRQLAHPPGAYAIDLAG